jgi:hypothetical protein
MHKMKQLILAACLSMLAIAQVQAKDAPADTRPAKELTPQQQKMKDCNADAKAKALKGADRKTFMKECLSAKGVPAAAAPAAESVVDKKATQQGKMKTCNGEAKAKSLGGDARKTFMKECLSAK